MGLTSIYYILAPSFPPFYASLQQFLFPMVKTSLTLFPITEELLSSHFHPLHTFPSLFPASRPFLSMTQSPPVTPLFPSPAADIFPLPSEPFHHRYTVTQRTANSRTVSNVTGAILTTTTAGQRSFNCTTHRSHFNTYPIHRPYRCFPISILPEHRPLPSYTHTPALLGSLCPSLLPFPCIQVFPPCFPCPLPPV